MEQGRLIVDADGIEWEVYDESRWTVAWALDWEYPPQTTNPGLLFDSTLGRHRVFPCPAHWQTMSDAELKALLKTATSLT